MSPPDARKARKRDKRLKKRRAAQERDEEAIERELRVWNSALAPVTAPEPTRKKQRREKDAGPRDKGPSGTRRPPARVDETAATEPVRATKASRGKAFDASGSTAALHRHDAQSVVRRVLAWPASGTQGPPRKAEGRFWRLGGCTCGRCSCFSPGESAFRCKTCGCGASSHALDYDRSQYRGLDLNPSVKQAVGRNGYAQAVRAREAMQLLYAARVCATLHHSGWTETCLERLNQHLCTRLSWHRRDRSHGDFLGILEKLATLSKEALTKTGRWSLVQMNKLERARAHVSCICSIDELYFNLFYYFGDLRGLLDVSSDNQGEQWLAPLGPHTYFRSIEDLFDWSSHEADGTSGLAGEAVAAVFALNAKVLVRGKGRALLRKFLANEVQDRDASGSLLESMEVQLGAAESSSSVLWNPLLDIFRYRYYEGLRLFYATGLLKDGGDMDRVHARLAAARKGKGGKGAPKKKDELEDPPCYVELQEWRDTSRDWLCRLFAFAVPNTKAISTLASMDLAIVEIGAGTGYWASLLRRWTRTHDSKTVIHAFDACPGRGNEYHGDCVSFTEVLSGGVGMISRFEEEQRRKGAKREKLALLLCYPPPDTSMAQKCLKLFQGDVVVYVGELFGNTGTSQFHRDLFAKFVATEKILLPNFGNTCYGMTIWKRKRGDNTRAGLDVFSCKICHRSPVACGSLFRCIFCRDSEGVFCSEVCKDLGANSHHCAHLTRLMYFRDPPGIRVSYEPIHLE
eukprot:scaffold420_cov404-Prasinococcus_capsulatus_cf.AAC.7